jgi:hypothetical protein
MEMLKRVMTLKKQKAKIRRLQRTNRRMNWMMEKTPISMEMRALSQMIMENQILVVAAIALAVMENPTLVTALALVVIKNQTLVTALALVVAVEDPSPKVVVEVEIVTFVKN